MIKITLYIVPILFLCFIYTKEVLSIGGSKKKYQKGLKEKSYVVTGHLGSVRSNIASYKSKALTANVISPQNYYPYGSTLNSSPPTVAASYGFQGKQTDNELKGIGNSYDFDARLYDTRVGRWLSNDPLYHKQPWLAPYQGMRLNPIRFVDPDGRSERYFGPGLWIQNKSKLHDRIADNLMKQCDIHAGAWFLDPDCGKTIAHRIEADLWRGVLFFAPDADEMQFVSSAAASGPPGAIPIGVNYIGLRLYKVAKWARKAAKNLLPYFPLVQQPGDIESQRENEFRAVMEEIASELNGDFGKSFDEMGNEVFELIINPPGEVTFPPAGMSDPDIVEFYVDVSIPIFNMVDQELRDAQNQLDHLLSHPNPYLDPLMVEEIDQLQFQIEELTNSREGMLNSIRDYLPSIIDMLNGVESIEE